MPSCRVEPIGSFPTIASNRKRRPDAALDGAGQDIANALLFSDELLVALRHARLIRDIALERHVQVVLVAQLCNRLHHRRCMVGIDCRLVLPGVNQKDGLRVVEGDPVLIAEIARLSTDGIDRTRRFHLLGELLCAAVFSRIPQIDCDSHCVSSISLGTAYSFDSAAPSAPAPATPA